MVTTPIVKINNLTKIFHTLKEETLAVKDFSLDIYKGEFLVLVGPSGCGKSTILSALAGLIKPSGGEIKFNPSKIVGERPSIGYMLQQDHLFQWRTILQNVVLGLEIQGKHTRENIKKVEQLLHMYGLGDFKHHYPNQLSGGMRQRAALIRTLAIDPEILLLDEPFSALDYQTRLAVADDIGSIIRQEKRTAIMVTHDISEAISSKKQNNPSMKQLEKFTNFYYNLYLWCLNFYRFFIIKKFPFHSVIGRILGIK